MKYTKLISVKKPMKWSYYVNVLMCTCSSKYLSRFSLKNLSSWYSSDYKLLSKCSYQILSKCLSSRCIRCELDAH